ncbi:short chain dehydrogenase/ reductase [Calocera viscosa TUFC12733]|uniref:Short chain dehydrogenase/ reductase n=1 Tax=Calocera viscosa (strain TUFC12733) TaxID=1330018 RepID=A0A167PBB2_CALVF|nr:short chain dehydrogenase/ reductase [Calocera viscosa TUFC12733]
MTSLNITEQDLLGAKDKVVIITGGSAGIGLATTQLFSRLGAHVFVGDVNPLPSPLPNTTFVRTDVSKWSDLLELYSTAFSAHKRIDIVIANAGVAEIDDILSEEVDDQGRLKEPSYKTVDINLRGVLNCTKLAAHYMRKTGGGSVSITGSVASYLGGGVPIYTTTKHGVLGLTRGIAKSLKELKITINVTAPFFTESNLMFPELREMCARKNVPVSDASSVAKALAYNALQGGDWTGKAIWVAADKWGEVEGPISALRKQWLGEEFDELFVRAWADE